MTRGHFSYAIRSVLASAVLFYAYRLSASGRGWIDWTVLALATLAVVWNLLQLGRRFHAAGRPRDVWHLLRTLGFWAIGIMNTLLRPEPHASWKIAVGWLVLLLAAVDTVAIARKEQELLGRLRQPDGPQP